MKNKHLSIKVAMFGIFVAIWFPVVGLIIILAALLFND
jgi:hypothetical protein